MSRGGKWRADLVPGTPQTRTCQCHKPAALERSEGRCVKCGYQAEPEPPATDHANTVAQAIAQIITRP